MGPARILKDKDLIKDEYFLSIGRVRPRRCPTIARGSEIYSPAFSFHLLVIRGFSLGIGGFGSTMLSERLTAIAVFPSKPSVHEALNLSGLSVDVV